MLKQFSKNNCTKIAAVYKFKKENLGLRLHQKMNCLVIWQFQVYWFCILQQMAAQKIANV